jgi:hypothetical protein
MGLVLLYLMNTFLPSINMYEEFLAAQSSSRSHSVGPLVRWSVGPSVRRSVVFVKKWPLDYQQVIKTYFPTYLWDISDSSDSSDSCDSSDSSDSSESSDSSDKKFFLPKNSTTQIVMKLKLWWNSKTQIVRKLKNSNYEKNLKTQIVMKLKNSNYDKT